MEDSIGKNKNYQIEIEDMVVTIEYSANGKKLNECLLDFLKEKSDKFN